MLIRSSLMNFGTVSIALLVGLLVAHTFGPSQVRGFNLIDASIAQPIPSPASTGSQSRSLVTLMDGDYQFCSQPEPTDWRDGAGVCFNFNKLGHHVEGYYGYPHSDRFICIQGEVDGNQITGEALAVSWAGAWWNEIPTSVFEWDDEKHLTLDQGELIRPSGDSQNQVDQIVFHRVVLNVDGFYQYSSPRMNSPSELCQFL